MGIFTKTKKCLFCLRKQKLTREHIYSKWLTSAYPVEEGTQVPSFHLIERSISNGNADRMGSNITDGRKIIVNDFVSKCVCEECNGGWMSKLETEAKLILPRFFNDAPKENLSPEDAYKLSKWALLKVLLICTVIQEKVFFADMIYSQLKEGIIPEGFMVEMMPMQSNRLNHMIGGHVIRVAKRINREELDLGITGFFKSTLQIGRIALRVSYLRTEIPISRIQIHKKPYILYPYNAVIPIDQHEGYGIAWNDVEDKMEMVYLNEFLGITD